MRDNEELGGSAGLGETSSHSLWTPCWLSWRAATPWPLRHLHPRVVVCLVVDVAAILFLTLVVLDSHF